MEKQPNRLLFCFNPCLSAHYKLNKLKFRLKNVQPMYIICRFTYSIKTTKNRSYESN